MTRKPALKPSRSGSQPARFERDHTLSGPKTPHATHRLGNACRRRDPPARAGWCRRLPCRDISVVSAIRYVVEELSGDERPRAVVRTPTASLFINEIEALYGQPEFPKAA
jgi:hypothetical protein